MASYTLNDKLNGIEISFSEKPTSEILTALKANGYRWHGKKHLWYAKQTAERIQLAQSIASEGKPIADRQSELKALYSEIMQDYWKDARMIDHCIKHTARIVELDDGDITTIEKPSIETHFCFGYGYCGVSTQEDMDNAHEAMHYADTHEDYFISENMKQINGYIENLKDDSIRAYKYVAYCSNCDTRLKDIGFYRYYESPASNLKECKEITKEERDNLIAGYEEVKKQFEKRLQTYLKRYGLSKLHTWTYLSD